MTQTKLSVLNIKPKFNFAKQRFIPYVTFIILLGRIHLIYGQDTTCDEDVPSRPVPSFPGVTPTTEIQPTVCAEGEYVDGGVCTPCEDGTFRTRRMSEQREHTRCLRCYEPGRYEIVAEPCTKTRDAKIMCEDGYFRSQIPGKPCKSECKRCDVCGAGINMFLNVKSRECSGYQNTVCCPYDNMFVEDIVCIDGSKSPEKSFYTASTSKGVSTATVGHSERPIDNAAPQCCANLPVWIVILLTNFSYFNYF